MNLSQASKIPNNQEFQEQKSPELSLIQGGRHELGRVLEGVNDDLRQGLRLATELSLKQSKKPTQDAVDIKELMKMAKRVRPAHNQLCQELASMTGGEFHDSKLKKKSRIWVKVEDLEGDINRVLDVVRSRIEFDDIASLYKAVEMLHGKAKVTRIKDRFISPAKSGYRDLLFNLEFTDPKTGKKHITELQFQLKNIAKAKAAEYKHYKKRRDIEARLETLKMLNGDPEEIRKLEIEASFSLKESQEIYEKSWEKHKGVFDSAKNSMSA